MARLRALLHRYGPPFLRKISDLLPIARLEKITTVLVLAGFLCLPIAATVAAKSEPPVQAPPAVGHSAQHSPTAHREPVPVPPQPTHNATKQNSKPSQRPAPLHEGVDYSYDHPDLQQLRRAGKSFVVRYLTGGSPKALSHPEAHAIRAAGLDVISNYEETTSDLTSGDFAHGVELAKKADAAHRASGGPSNAPIYFSADSSPEGWSPAEWHSFDQNLRGIASVIGVKRVGLYGGTLALKTAQSHRLVSWYWQSLGWRGGEWLGWAHLQQHHNNAPLGGGTVDKNRAMAGDYGQWSAAAHRAAP